MRDLDDFFRPTHDDRVRALALMILLLAEQGLAVSEVAVIVRESGGTVRRWAHRYEVEGIDGLTHAPRSGKPAKVGAAHRERLVELVRRRPRTLDLPISLWTAARLTRPSAGRCSHRRNGIPRSEAVAPSSAISWFVNGTHPSARFGPRLARQRSLGRRAAFRLIRNSSTTSCTTCD
ncbi:helix-turn-helix domain-containing protein, partial [Methylobacterium fujisawaense]|uniref:helix-turn-helix domain-containing protein n=1 Tax=Methylobacterium fujisawaense TaxID=107400 RepID=UPI00313DD00A